MDDPITSSNSSTWVPPANGIVGGYTGDNVNINRAMMAFAAIAWYNSIELIFLILMRFKHFKGLYFWSLMTTAWAIIIYVIGAWGKMANIASQTLITQTFCNIGWISMVTGNSLVLYSRLHLLTQRYTLLRYLLWIILINSFVLYIPTTALDYGCNVNPTSQGYCDGYSIMERIQMTMFCIQEFAISGIYLLEARRYLKTTYRGDLQTKYILYELVAVNLALIALDVALLSVEYEDLYQIEVTLKGFVYSLKLKLELGVLSRLVKIVCGKHKSPLSFRDYNDKADGSEHIESKSPSSSNPRSSSTIPWLSRISTRQSHQSSAPAPQPLPPSSLEFVTTADLGKPDPTLNSNRVVHTPLNAETYHVQHEPPQLAVPPQAIQRLDDLSRQSSMSIRYPGRITGG